MAKILTFLGKGGTGRTTVAIATAKALAAGGQRVLLVGQPADSSLGLLMNCSLTGNSPQTVAENLQVIQLRTTQLLEQSWQELKQMEGQYLRVPFFKSVFGQELGVLPGFDQAFTLKALWEFDTSGNYDLIVLDGEGNQNTLRMLGLPEILGWYVRRFRQVLAESELSKNLSPFVQPIASALLNVNSSSDAAEQPWQDKITHLLEQGERAIADPNRFVAYLVTNPDPVAVETAVTLWGAAQQIGLSVGGVFLNQSLETAALVERFSPLPVTVLPTIAPDQWPLLSDRIPNLAQDISAPLPLKIDLDQRQVSLFLPGFDKKSIKLCQSGPEVTVEAGDQRRNLLLPLELRGQPVSSAKFEQGYLLLSF
jgi:anion-transporting  ArsA/GET3 family ATPase